MLLVGMGGLGCPAALALAQAGVRALTLVDPDVVEPSNLHRQVWYREADVGRAKVEVAAERLRAAFPGLAVDAQVRALDEAQAREEFPRHPVVLDGVDGAATKFALARAALACGVPLIHGGVLRLEGLAVRLEPGGPCLQCLFDGPPQRALTCAQAGVLGSVAGLVGALQASLALRAEPRPGESTLLRVDGRAMTVRAVPLKRDPACPACGPQRTALWKAS